MCSILYYAYTGTGPKKSQNKQTLEEVNYLIVC